MDNLILISHGPLCTAMKKSAEMIFGPLNCVYTVELLENEGPTDFQNKFDRVTHDLDNFTVFADLMGGTPCNQVTQILLKSDKQFNVYAGMNFPMVVSFINSQLNTSSSDFVSASRNGIVKINDMLDDNTEEEF